MCSAFNEQRGISSLDTYIQEVLSEETWLLSQRAHLEETKVFATPTSNDAALITPHGAKVQCSGCKGYQHVALNSKKKNFCNYYKRYGHVIF